MPDTDEDDMAQTALFDLGVADVHQAAPLGVEQGYSQGRAGSMSDVDMKVTAQKRASLKPSQFAWPEKKKYPIDTKERVRSAESYLEKEHGAGNVPDSVYPKARARIARAARRFGIESKYNERTTASAGIAVRAHIAPGGQLHVRHLSDLGRFTAALPPMRLDAKSADGDEPVWIQLAKAGRFRGHKQGAFELNDQVFAEICRNFTEVDGGTVPFDFEHASEQDPTKGDIATEGAPATGRIVGLRGTPGALFAQVKWLEPAKSYIRQGRYWGVSPAIRFGDDHPETGKPIGARLTSAALTNQPFLRGMLPIAAKDTGRAGEAFVATDADSAHVTLTGGMKDLCYSAHEYMPKIRQALRTHDLTSAQECADHVGRLRAAFETAGSAHATHEGVKLSDYLMPMRDLVGASPSMSWEDVLDTVDRMIDEAIDQHVLEYHGAEAAGMSDHDEEETTTMSDAEKQALQTQLADETKKRTTAEGQVASLTLKVQATEAKVTAVEEEKKKLETKVTELTAKVSTIETAALEERVNVAMADHKESQKLTDKHRPMMLRTLRESPTEFEELYPKKAPTQRTMTQRVTPPAPGGARTEFDEHGAVGAGGEGEEFVATNRQELAEQIMLSSKCSYEEAMNQAALAFATE